MNDTFNAKKECPSLLQKFLKPSFAQPNAHAEHWGWNKKIETAYYVFQYTVIATLLKCDFFCNMTWSQLSDVVKSQNYSSTKNVRAESSR